MKDDFKKIAMAGVGMASTAVEKTKDTIDKYAQKGERVLDDEDTLIHQIKDKMDDSIEDMKDKGENFMNQVKNKVSQKMK